MNPLFRSLAVSLIASFSAHAGVVVQGQHSTTDLAYASEVKSIDLINASQPTLSSATVSASNASFPGSGINDGACSNTPAANTYFQSVVHFPAIATYQLNLTSAPEGYDICSITSLMGWATVSRYQANQNYTVEVSVVGSAEFSPLAHVEYTPFSGSGGNYETKITVTENTTGVLARNVSAIRFIFADPSNHGANSGTVVREIDVNGYPANVPLTLTSPTGSFLVQRNAANTGTIPVTGYYSGTPERIEARAVVMSGSNFGMTTNWQTIATAPTGSSFAGSLTHVPAGGWYRLEVRSVTGATSIATASVDQIGVGDIFITAGQSNSANHGAPALSPTNSHVVAMSALSGGTWGPANDPQPMATGSGGSVWSRLGDLYAASQNVPVGFVSVGVGATQTSQWLPSANQHYPRIRSAVKLFPINGFKALLWHQGESDAIANSSSPTYQANLQAIISQSRADAGWAVPWSVAEASFHPNTNLTQELQVNAGQRATAYADPLVQLGPRTDDFHLEGKVSDTVHFNAAGLADHAQQWLDLLTGSQSIQVRNGTFEANTALADGGTAATDTSANSSPSVIGWQMLAAGGNAAADGSNGYSNPTAIDYTNAVDSSNGGVAANMSGKHVAYLFNGSAGNHFLQTFRVVLLPNTDYTLRVAMGRRLAGLFGGAKIELLGDGQPLGSGLTVQESDLATNAFTDVAFTYRTSDTQAAGVQLAIRITKIGGVGTYLDFDNVRFTATRTAFGLWQESHYGSTINPLSRRTADPDQDSLMNIFEFILGTPPYSLTSLPAPIRTPSGARYEIPLNPDADEPGFDVLYSLDLATWHSASSPAHAGITSQRTSMGWTVDALGIDRAFFRMIVPN